MHLLLLILAEYISTQPYYYSPLLDPSSAGNYPEWDEGHAGADETAGDEDPYYEEQGEVDTHKRKWIKINSPEILGTSENIREESKA